MRHEPMDYKKFYDRTWNLELAGSGEQFRGSPLRRFLRRFDLDRHELMTSLIRQSRATSGGKFADIGCGTAELMWRLQDDFDECVGVDVSPVVLETARARFTGHSAARRMTFLEHTLDAKLPFDDASFDAVACNAVLEHVFDVYGLMSELARIVKPGGNVVVEVPNVAYLRHRIGLLLGRLPITSSYPSPEFGWDGGHLHYFTQRTLFELIRWSGLEPRRVSGGGAFGQYRNWWPSLLCGDLVVVSTKRGDDI